MDFVNKINEIELKSNGPSWHDDYKESAYIYIGGIDTSFSEGDILVVFSQYGEIIDLEYPREEKTGIPKGFCFLAYEDQRSTNLAVDNFNGIKLGDRIIKVDHKLGYFKKVKEGEEVQKPYLLQELEKKMNGEELSKEEEEEKKKEKKKKKRKGKKKPNEKKKSYY
jgi:RNA-binding motif protein, X-linked 2